MVLWLLVWLGSRWYFPSLQDSHFDLEMDEAIYQTKIKEFEEKDDEGTSATIDEYQKN